VVQRALVGGDVAAALAATGMTGWPNSGDADLDLMVLAYRGPARMRAGDYAEAIADLEQALALAERGSHDELTLWTLSQLSGISGAACDFEGMKAWSDRAIAFALPRGWGDSPRLAYAYLLAAWTGFQTGDVEAQTFYAERAVDCLDTVANVEVELGVRSMAALAGFEASDGEQRYQAARDFHELWRTPAAEQISPALIGFATPQEVRLALTVGETGWAVEATRRVERQLPASAEAITLRATLTAARGRTSAALSELQPVLRDEVPMHVRTTGVTADLLAWQLFEQCGNPVHAHQSLTRALDWAAPRNFRRPFLELGAELRQTLAADAGRFGRADAFAEDLLRAICTAPAVRPTVAASQATLTPTELDVLRDLPSQLGAARIAETRSVSLNTVKTHLASIYRKLGVAGRREAVMEARRLGLI
jgi:LuxR family maltose regulon positive regulatory protein